MSALQSAILKHLQADAAITALVAQRIYPDCAPEGAAYPLIVVSAVKAPAANRTYGPTVSYQTSRWLVKAIDKNSSPATASAISEAIQTSLDNAALTVTGQTVEACLWYETVEYSEQAPGVTYQHQGTIFEVMTT